MAPSPQREILISMQYVLVMYRRRRRRRLKRRYIEWQLNIRHCRLAITIIHRDVLNDDAFRWIFFDGKQVARLPLIIPLIRYSFFDPRLSSIETDWPQAKWSRQQAV